MILILNEKELLRKSLEEGYIDNDKTSNTIRILAKHYFSIDMSKEQVYDSVNKFFIDNYQKYNSVKWQITFDRIIDKVYKDKDFSLLDINSIEITKSELNKIKSLNNIKYEKIAFILLVYAKIYNQMNKNELGWVNIDQKYIFSDAKVKENIRNQGIILHTFEELGLITPSKMVNCTNIKVNYTDINSPIELKINDFRNYVYEYLRWKGENIINCENKECNILFIPSNNKSKYCSICAKEIEKENHKERNREHMRKKRAVDEIENA
jgi:hypothetical protein